MYLMLRGDNFEKEKSLDLKIDRREVKKVLILLKLEVLNAQ